MVEHQVLSELDILLAGCYFCDLVFTGLKEMPAFGKEIFSEAFDMLPGGTFNTALALHRLGVKAAWSTDFGNDFFSQTVLKAARHEGVPDTLFRIHDHPIRFVSAAFSFPQDRAFMSYIDPLDEEISLEEIVRYRPHCLLVPYLFYGEKSSQVFELAHQEGAILFMDCQSVKVTLKDAGITEAIRHVDIFAPNAAEACQLTGKEQVDDALACLAELVPLVVIKLGKDGAIAQAGDQVYRMPAWPVKVVDTTAAGDCFNAGFLYGYLQGKSVDDCLRYGTLCGSLSTTARGCLATPDRQQLEELFEKAKRGRAS